MNNNELIIECHIDGTGRSVFDMNYEQLLEQLCTADERFVVLTAENRAPIRSLPEKLGPRFIDTGITEQTMIGAAAGLALRGRIPVVHALAAFLTMRAFEFIRTDVGIGNLPVKLVGYIPGFLSEANGPTHQALEDVAIMRGIPNVNVFCPADEDDMLTGLPEVLQSASPFYIRYNPLKTKFSHSKSFEIGKAEYVQEGDDVALLVYGMLFQTALETTSLLSQAGYSVRLINMRTLKPVDEEAIVRAVRETPLVVTLEDHFMTGGLYSIVSEVISRHEIFGSARVMPVALSSWFKPALLADVLNYEGFTAAKLAESISKKIKSKQNKKNLEVEFYKL